MAHLAICGGTPVRTKPFSPWPVYDERDKQALIDVLESRKWGIGSKTVERFENEFARFCGVDYAIACTNGTHAISIALQALGIGADDEVIIPPYTFIATGIASLTVNAIPVFADIHPATYNIDPATIESKITPKTKAIIPVHIAGNPADMDAIDAIAKRHNVIVLEDSAQAHGAEWKGRRTGSLGHAATFSFQSSKNLSSGEGGAVTTNDETLAERIRSFTNCGRVKGGAWYDHHEMGGNHRLGAFQAALLCVGLERIEEQMIRREENAAYLRSLLESIDGMSMTETHAGTTRHAYHLGILRYDGQAFKGLSKARFVEALVKEGIESSTGYIPLYKYHFFRHFAEKVKAYDAIYKGLVDYSAAECPVCERVCDNEAVWLMQETFLGTKQDMDDVAEAVRKVQKYADEAIER